MWSARSPRLGFRDLCTALAVQGDLVAPRGVTVREFIGAHMKFHNPTDAVITRPNYNPRIAVVEALQLMSGEHYPQAMVKATENMAQFMNGGIFAGAYGPRVRTQLPHLVDRLKKDPASRQAIITLWDPVHDMFDDDRRDRPCTTSIQFLIRGGELDMIVYMRSNDVWWGFTYDAFQFVFLQATLAQILDVEVGEYVHNVGSFHMYSRDLHYVDKEWECEQVISVAALDDHRSLEHHQIYARALLDAYVGTQRLPPGVPTTDMFEWMRGVLSV